jgi:phosphohistidine phosphatase
MLIGHNPGMHELAASLAGSRESDQTRRLRDGFPTAALAEFAISRAWESLDSTCSQLVRYLTPRDLPETAG